MHIVGLSLLIFVVLPELDVVKGAMITNCLCFIPAVLQLASRHSKESRRFLKVLMDLVAIGGQCTGFFVWPLVEVRIKGALIISYWDRVRILLGTFKVQMVPCRWLGLVSVLTFWCLA